MEFKFYQDVKYTIWERHHFTVEADSKEQAITKVKETADFYSFDGVSEIDTENFGKFQECEPLFDTLEYIPSEENGASTIEIYTEKGELIFENYDYNKGGVSEEIQGE